MCVYSIIPIFFKDNCTYKYFFFIYITVICLFIYIDLVILYLDNFNIYLQQYKKKQDEEEIIGNKQSYIHRHIYL